MCYGQPLAGVEKGPTEIRKANLRLSVTALGWRWADQGDVLIPKPRSSDPKPPFGGKNMYAVGVANNNIHKATAAAAAEGDFVLTLGGDHSIAMGSIAGVLTARPELAVVWVDAHADINLPDTSPSGNVHGMPLSFLLRLVDPSLVPGCEWLAGTPPLTTSRLVYVGLRDLDTGEKKAIRSAGIRAFTMQDVDKHGIGKVGTVSP
jgi:arginase